MSYREPDKIHKTPSVPEPHIGEGEHRQGDLLGGRYRVLSLLGRGGMGVVYKVEQIFLGKELALKTIDRASQSEIAIRRFQAEARAVFAVNHPNIVSVHDFGLLDDQTPFLAMEFVQGRTIGELIQARPLSIDEALKIFIQVCFGLAHAHKNGVVHRDIKPNNIMILDGMPIGTEGSVKILDFGIAKLTQHDAGEIQALTKTGEIFGSPIYMSPEQCTGEKIDHRADVYSLGCVIFEALTGTPPFVGESALSTMMMHQTAPTPTLKEASLGADFPPELELLVHTMLSKNPDDRYQDLGIAAHDLAAIKSGQLESFSLGAKSHRLLKPKAVSTFTMKRKHFILWIANVAIVSTVGTFLIMQLIYLSQKSTPTTHALVAADDVTLIPKDPGHAAYKKQVQNKWIKLEEKFVTDEDLKNIKGYKDAQVVSIQEESDDYISNKGLSYLTDSKLLKLTLHGQIQKIDNYTQLKYLMDLNLSKSPVSNAALANIADLKMLSVLNLERCSVLTEDGIRNLIPSTSLVHIILTRDKYAPSFISEMHEKMPQCKIGNYDQSSPLVTELNRSKKSDEYKTSQALYKKMQAIHPHASANADLLKNMSEVRLKQKRYSETRKLLDEAIQVLNKNQNEIALPPFLKSAAEAASADHDDRAAVKYTDRIVEILPKAMMHDEQPMYDNFTSILQYPARLHDWSKVVDYCNVVIPLAERFPEAAHTKNRFEYYSQAGDAYVSLKKNSEASENFKKLAQLSDTDREEDFYWHASACVRLGRTLTTDDEQKTSYLEGIRLIEEKGMPDINNILEHYCDACVNVGVILLKEGKWEEAIEYNKKGLATTEKMLKDLPKHVDAKDRRQAHALDIINILKRHGRIEDAKAMAQKYHFNNLHFKE